MSVQIVRFTTDPERVEEIETAIGELFEAVASASPEGIDYSAVRLGEAPEYQLTLRLSHPDINPLLDIPAAGAFRPRIAEWAGGPVPPVPARELGSYSG